MKIKFRNFESILYPIWKVKDEKMLPISKTIVSDYTGHNGGTATTSWLTIYYKLGITTMSRFRHFRNVSIHK